MPKADRNKNDLQVPTFPFTCQHLTPIYTLSIESERSPESKKWALTTQTVRLLFDGQVLAAVATSGLTVGVKPFWARVLELL